ncbi:hypothetical protein [Capnocytophaga bilenii]
MSILSFGASRTGFTYSAVPARRLSFGASRTGCLILRHILGCASSPTFLRLSFAYPSSHTRLRQLADFPSLILRWEEL